MNNHPDRIGRDKRTFFCLLAVALYVALDVLFIKKPLFDMTIPYQLELRKTYGQNKNFNLAIEIVA